MDDVYLSYAKAMHLVQRLERVSVNILGVVRRVQRMDDKDVEVTSSLLSTLLNEAAEIVRNMEGREKTLGPMFKELYRETSTPASARAHTKCGSFRNVLAHSFLVDADLATSRGRQITINELRKSALYFHTVCDVTITTLREALEEAHLSKEEIDEFMQGVDTTPDFIRQDLLSFIGLAMEI